MTTNTTQPGRRAYQKVGGREQPGQASDVTDVDGTTTTTTLRNINGALAVHQLHGNKMQRQAVIAATVNQLFAAAFAGPRDPRSNEYCAGVYVALAFRIKGAPIPRPYTAATAADDEFYAGQAEGHAIWCRAQEAGAV